MLLADGALAGSYWVPWLRHFLRLTATACRVVKESVAKFG